MKEIFEDFLTFIIASIIFGIMIMIGLFSLSEHKVNGYYIGSIANGANIVKIGVDINWQIDKEIPLDRSITIQEAIELVAKLNESLK